MGNVVDNLWMAVCEYVKAPFIELGAMKGAFTYLGRERRASFQRSAEGRGASRAAAVTNEAEAAGEAAVTYPQVARGPFPTLKVGKEAFTETSSRTYPRSR
ncbi:hypothetical protein DMC63_31845 [Streptomyces sp. WAC 05977]|nr:hypothetical protein DMC63_31845 [Streptomyces sp. WAC 05977]